MRDRVRVVSVFPDLLGTYGDSGNAVILARRLEMRGYQVDLVIAEAKTPVPSDGEFYLIGGGEDGPQAKAADLLAVERPLAKALEHGAALLAVCAGFQILGESFLGPDMKPKTGMGIFQTRTHRFDGPRSVGELVVRPVGAVESLPLLSGYENHQGITEVLSGAEPLGEVVHGNGNNFGQDFDGAVAGRAFGTYLHGPVFARNPQFCDFIISQVLADVPPLENGDLAAAHEILYSERMAAVLGQGVGPRRQQTSSLPGW